MVAGLIPNLFDIANPSVTAASMARTLEIIPIESGVPIPPVTQWTSPAAAANEIGPDEPAD